MLTHAGGHWHKSGEQVEGWDELVVKMNNLQQDTTLTRFLRTYFNSENDSALRQSALQYAQGFDAVNPDNASVFALRNEWQHEQEEMYRIDGGYLQLIQYLVTCCLQKQCTISYNAVVKKVEWKEGEVKVSTHAGEDYEANQVMITVPVGVLASQLEAKAHINFLPALQSKTAAARQIGFGNVIKILLRFSVPFWQDKGDVLFFFSDQKIPTWWTQLPFTYPILTGWLAGSATDSFFNLEQEEILDVALQSLANIFQKKKEELRQLLTASYVVNWQQDEFAQGAYSYSTLASDEAKKELTAPVQNTIFFAGEGLYSGTAGGTVEAALVSGLHVAKRILEK